MKPEIQLTAREKRRMMRVLFNERISLKEAAKIKVRPLCCPTEGELTCLCDHRDYRNCDLYKDDEETYDGWGEEE